MKCRTGGSVKDALKSAALLSTLREAAAREQPDIDSCVICLEAITEPCKLAPCGHQNFDYPCVVKWLLETPKCPLCKASASKVLHGSEERHIATPAERRIIRQRRPPPFHSALPEVLLARRRRGDDCPWRQPRRRPVETPSDQEAAAAAAVLRRRQVYIHKRYSKHVGSNRLSRYRELTPAMFRSDEQLVSRARMWIRRELQVFAFLSGDNVSSSRVGAQTASVLPPATERRRTNNAEFLLEYIIAILRSVDVLGSAGQAEDMLSDFLGRDNARLFWHELRAWLRSPYTRLEDWDKAVQYDPIEGEATDLSNWWSRHRMRRAREEQNAMHRRVADLYRPSSSRLYRWF